MQAVHDNQPYDESLEVPDAEEIASQYTPTPRRGVPLRIGTLPVLTIAWPSPFQCPPHQTTLNKIHMYFASCVVIIESYYTIPQNFVTLHMF